MELLSMQSTASRRAFSIRPLLRHTFGHLPGDEPSSEETGFGRSADEYIPCYPMKKCRSHTFMSNANDCVPGCEDCGYVITSAPDNAFCLIDTDAEGDDDADDTSACCAKQPSTQASGCCPHAIAQLHLGLSASSSTAVSSALSGISSPSPLVQVTTDLPCSCHSVHSYPLSVPSGLALTGPGTPAPHPMPHTIGQHASLAPHQHSHHQASETPSAAASGIGAPAAVGTVPIAATGLAEDNDGGDGSSGGVDENFRADGTFDLMRAFGSLTADQWVMFKSAVSGGAGAALLPARLAAGASAERASAGAAQVSALQQQAPLQRQNQQQFLEQLQHTARAQCPQRDSGRVGNEGDGLDCHGVPRASPPPSPSHSPAGGSNSSIASLWVAVNHLTDGSGVYDSTDDSAQATQMMSLLRGREPTAAAAAASLPVAVMDNSDRQGPSLASSLQMPSSRAAAAVLSSNSQTHSYAHSQQQQQPQRSQHHHYFPHHLVSAHDAKLDLYLASRKCKNPEAPLPQPAMVAAAAAGRGDGDREEERKKGGPTLIRYERPGGEALSEPHSPTTAPFDSYLDIEVGSRCTTTAEATAVVGAKGGISHDACGGSSSASGTVDQSYSCSYGDAPYANGGGSGYTRAASARYHAHSRFSVDLPPCSRPSLSQQQQQQQPRLQQQQDAKQQQAAAAVAAAHSLFPSRRRAGGTLAQPTSYTTYGYRRACSSLAALERSVRSSGCGSSSSGDGDDDDDEDDTDGTRLIAAAARSHTGMARCSGLGLLGSDSAPTTPGAEAGRRDYWAVAGMKSGHTAAGMKSGHTAAGASVGGGGRGGAGNGGSLHGSGACGSTANGEHCTVSAGGGDASVGSKEGGGSADGGGGRGPEDEAGLDGALTRKRSSYHLTSSHAAVELFLRLNHARQTMDFVKRQTQLFAQLDKARMTVWEALNTLNELREYDAVLMAEGSEVQEISSLSLLDHAFQTAEMCRLHHPSLDWLHLVGLIHGLGKLLAHRRFGSQPQWAVCGETYPLGCRFSPHILGSQYFTANPDRRRRLYNTPSGLYEPCCGLLNVVMSWSAPEYLYLALMLNNAPMPQDALWVLRHAKFQSLTRPHSCYLPLCCPDDLRLLPLLRSFQGLSSYRRMALPEGFALSEEQRTSYYGGLIAKYIGEAVLSW